MNWRRIGGYTALGFAAYWMLTSPTSAADTVRTIFGGLIDAAENLSAFINALS